LLHIYVFVRLASLPFCKLRVKRWGLIGIGLAFWLIFFYGRVFRGYANGFLTAALEVAGMHWMASVSLIAVGLFAADLACGFGFLFPKMVNRIRTWGLASGLTLVFIAHVQGFSPPLIEPREVVIPELPAHLNGTTIAVMADLHAGEMMIGAGWLNARIDQVRAL